MYEKPEMRAVMIDTINAVTLLADFVSPEHVEMAYKDMELMFRGWGVFDCLQKEG